MGMIEISQRGRGGVKDAYDNFKESMKCLKEDFETLLDEMEEMGDWAVSMMKTKEGKITPITKDQVTAMLKKYNITLEKDNGYNSVYVANMAKADYLGKSIPNEQYHVTFIRDYIDDPDYPTTEKAFRHFFADMMGMGKVINWKDML